MSHHEESLSQEELLQVVKGSFTTRLLTQQTAFIVVETNEQEEELIRLQQEYLSGKKHLEGGAFSTMAEPSLVLCAMVLLVSLGYFRKHSGSPGNG